MLISIRKAGGAGGAFLTNFFVSNLTYRFKYHFSPPNVILISLGTDLKSIKHNLVFHQKCNKEVTPI